MGPEELVKRYNFCKLGEDGVLEFFCDHTILSELRACEAYFIEQRTKRYSLVERNWNLDFGSWFHEVMEVFYKHEYYKLQRVLGTGIKSPNDLPSDYESIQKGAICAVALQLWDTMEMEYFKDHRNYKALKGPFGAAKLVSDYWNAYGDGKERLRVIGIEVPFGRNKEVPILNRQPDSIAYPDGNFDYMVSPVPEWYKRHPFRAYLTGKINLLIDDGLSIASMDHKSTAFFDGSEATKYVPHEGMEGYAFSADKMLRLICPGKRCYKTIINHVALQDNTSKKVASEDKACKIQNEYDYNPNARFTRSSITFTPEQYEEFRLRQASTFDILYQLLVLERPPVWNGYMCGNFYHKECMFKAIHGLTPSLREQIFKAQYKVIEAWSPFFEEKKENR